MITCNPPALIDSDVSFMSVPRPAAIVLTVIVPGWPALAIDRLSALTLTPCIKFTLPKTGPPLSLRAVAGCLLGKAPNPCSERTVNEWQTEHETLCCASL